ncbi:MAG: GHKL domain-containing protein [Bacilli bacterium]|nr:GHKL domain-containing protein [Bacilli bacterium]
MTKLKYKVFFTIFGIMTFFLLTIFITNTIQSYNNEKSIIEKSLNGIVRDRKENIPSFEDEPKPREDDTKNHIYIDQIVYTIILEEGEAVEINSHTLNEYDEEAIKEVAARIAKSNKTLEVTNLFFDDYSYSIKNNVLMLVDNSTAKERLLGELKVSLIIVIILECLITLASHTLTKWIIEPVEESFQKQKEFIADASHELKTPLSVIMANAEMLDTNPKEKKWLDNIHSESERMNKLISNLLDLARLENVDNKETFENTDISKLTEKAILPFEGLLFEHKVKFNYDIDEKIMYKCNSEEIKQLIAILLDNAIKHSEKNGEINVSLKKDKQITLIVSNKGKEIAKEDINHIFERFYRVDKSRNRDENRYGLGLAIAKKIVDNHNGKIKCTSEKGVTTFTAVLR